MGGYAEERPIIYHHKHCYRDHPVDFLFVLTQYIYDGICAVDAADAAASLTTQPEYITNLGQMCRVFCAPLVYSVKVTNGGLRCDALLLPSCRIAYIRGLCWLGSNGWCAGGWEFLYICIFTYAPLILKYISKARCV